MTPVKIIGGGLAGCEAAYQLAKRKIPVTIYEMRPKKNTPAHHTDQLAELVCSNSLRANRLENAVGLLKEEMRQIDSLIMAAADKTQVPAGGALAVDRHAFSQEIETAINNNEYITVIREEVETVSTDEPTIIAAGPLASDALVENMMPLVGETKLHFFDAAAPIVSAESLDMERLFFASRYDKGDADYLNAAMDEAIYRTFYHALVTAETAELKEFEKNPKVFEGCMPIEVMAKRGIDTMRFGPLKPVGLKDPRADTAPYAVVQLRKENHDATLFNLVGFQTNLKFKEQKRVFGLIPGLENAEFLRYGVMHRNTFIQSPGILTKTYQHKQHENLYFAGQITGVEGYIESASSGLVAGLALAKQLNGEVFDGFSTRTAIGALAHYVSSASSSHFQPMNINFGIVAPLEKRIRNKKERYTAIAMRALDEIKAMDKLKED